MRHEKSKKTGALRPFSLLDIAIILRTEEGMPCRTEKKYLQHPESEKRKNITHTGWVENIPGQPTTRRQKKPSEKGNSRRAKEKLYRLMVTNFKRDDYRIDLTYAEPAPDPGTALDRIRKFIRQLRSKYRKKKEELKYIYVTEYRGHRIHHHVLINAVEGIGRKKSENSGHGRNSTTGASGSLMEEWKIANG
jgi:hypothetical protein